MPSAVPVSTSGPVASAPVNNFGNLQDPAQWMKLVNDPTQLSGWLKSIAPNAPADLVSYYVGAIQKAPGANPTEQAGSAQYWTNKFTADPKAGVTGTGASTVLGQTTPTVGHTPSANATMLGQADVRGGQYADAYGAAYLASQLQRKKSMASGRSQTILGGFGSGAPATAPATALGA